MPRITRDDASDLKSYIDRATETAIELYLAEQAKTQADRQLAGFLEALQRAPATDPKSVSDASGFSEATENHANGAPYQKA